LLLTAAIIMSGVIGHSLYAILARKAAAARKSPIASLLLRNDSSFLAGAYLGCDIQTLPAALGLNTGAESGYGKLPGGVTELNGEPVRQWTLNHEGKEHTPSDIHAMYYGRAHLVLGWKGGDVHYAIPSDHLPDYFAAVTGDAVELFGPGERQLAYIFGWICHVIGDALIKSVLPGLDLKLLNGSYTPENRPIQDLVAFHEIGVKELGINWRARLPDICDTPVESIQPHYMRCAVERGRLGELFPVGWRPDREALLRRTMARNRVHLKVWLRKVFRDLELTRSGAGWECRPELSRKARGLSYAEMVELAEKANYRHALWLIAERIADAFDEVVERHDYLQSLPQATRGDWKEITERWKKK
jgi:hypothetical protein